VRLNLSIHFSLTGEPCLGGGIKCMQHLPIGDHRFRVNHDENNVNKRPSQIRMVAGFPEATERKESLVAGPIRTEFTNTLHTVS
jgi:hypothetical protein